MRLKRTNKQVADRNLVVNLIELSIKDSDVIVVNERGPYCLRRSRKLVQHLPDDDDDDDDDDDEDEEEEKQEEEEQEEEEQEQENRERERPRTQSERTRIDSCQIQSWGSAGKRQLVPTLRAWRSFPCLDIKPIENRFGPLLTPAEFNLRSVVTVER
ncbi:hypothetical protein HZH66_004295 [Vespula vulgaris]|uniref:Uncharacterized protein n=1 Tax=Vespula vulgaris TaxID=7454 RepID=A0A834KIG8_VESVU|nr:hypothetical protein HZH66_004295 [Vespula vulgaris]